MNASRPELSDAERRSRVGRAIRRAIDPGVKSVDSWREGIDCFADAVVLSDGTRAVAKSPRSEIVGTNYEGVVDFANLLAKEHWVLSGFATSGARVPRPIGFSPREGDLPSVVVMERVEDDARPARADEQRTIGGIVAELHAAGVELATGPGPVDRPDPGERLEHRLRAASKYCSFPLDGHVQEVSAWLSANAHSKTDRATVLHMDVRRENFAFSKREAAAFDFTNSVVGDRLWDLGRAKFNDLLTPEFIRGYFGSSPPDLDYRDRLAIELYELELAATLCVVFAEEVSEPGFLASVATRTERLLVDASGRVQAVAP